LLQATGKGRTFVKALATGRFPLEEIDKFAQGQPSLVDDFVGDPDQTLEEEINGKDSLSEDFAVDELVDEAAGGDGQELPVVEAKEALAVLDHAVVSSADEEAVEFLLTSAVDKIWKHAFRDEEAAVTQAENFSGGEYAERVRKRFLDEYRQAKELRIPQGYAFTDLCLDI